MTEEFGKMNKSSKVSPGTFREMFLRSVEIAIGMAQREVCGVLPKGILFRFTTSKSSKKENGLEFVLSNLYRDGAFPPVVDISICGIKDGKLVVLVMPSAFQWTTDLGQTWDKPRGTGPFKPIGPLLPSFMSERGRPFRLADLANAYAVLEEEWNRS